MTQEEQQLLNGLIDRVNSTQLTSKDPEAESLLRRTLGANPDALYILCQTVLVQSLAMDKGQRDLAAARAEIDHLRHSQPEKHGSFLVNLFGLGKDAESQQPAPPRTDVALGYQGSASYGSSPQPVPGYAPVANAPAASQQGYPAQPGYSAQTGYGQTPQPGYGYPPQGQAYGVPPSAGMFGGGGGFLQGAMQTAAGVVAGEFAFRAIEDIFSGGHGERGFGGGTEIVNNYYDDRPSDNDGGGFGDRLAESNNYDGSISPDIEDRRGEGRGFLDSGDSDANDGSDFADDSSNFDDGGGFDGGDSGGDDNSY